MVTETAKEKEALLQAQQQEVVDRYRDLEKGLLKKECEERRAPGGVGAEAGRIVREVARQHTKQMEVLPPPLATPSHAPICPGARHSRVMLHLLWL